MPTITYDQIYLSPEVTKQFGDQYNTQIIKIFSGLRGRGVNFEKLKGLPGLYSARGSRELRFLCTPYENSFVIIGVLEHHDYNLCTRLYNAHTGIKPSDFIELSLDGIVTIKALSMSAPDIYSYGSRYDYSPVIFLSDQQDDILTEIEQYSHQHPLFINGIAGTGKTTIAQYLLQSFRSDEKVLYICPDQFLATEQQRQFDLMVEAEQPLQEDAHTEPLHQTTGEIDSDTSSSTDTGSDTDSDSNASVETPNIQFKHIKQLYQELGLIAPQAQLENFGDFDKWLNAIRSDRKHSLNKITRSLESTDTYLYAEFKAMLSRGLTSEHQDTYQKLTVDLSSYSPEARENVFVLYSSYLNYLSANNITVIELIGPSALSEIKAMPFDRIIIDETQLFAYTILKNLERLCDSKLLMFGDYNQGKFYFRTKVLAESFPGLHIINLSQNQRCSQPVVEFANSTLELQRQYIGGEFEDNTVLSLVHMRKDEPPTSSAKFLDIPNLVALTSLANSGETVYIVNNDADEEKLKAMLGAGIAVLKDTEVCGLEFENVVLYNLISGHDTSQEYVDIAKYLHSQDQTEPVQGHRHKPKDKKAASARIKNIEKFRYLFLLITRARDSIYLVDDKKHPFVQQLVASAELTEHVPTESEIHEKCDAPNLSMIVHLLHGSQSQKAAISLLVTYLSVTDKDKAQAKLIIARTQEIIASKPDFRFNIDSLYSLIVTSNEQELDDEISKLLALDQQSTKEKSKSKAKASKPAPLDTVQSLIDQAEASPSAESTPKPESERPALIELFKRNFPLKEGAEDSLYAAISRSHVTYNNSSFSNLSSIKKLLFSNFPRNLTPPKSKGKSASQALTISIGGQHISQDHYISGKFTMSPEFREIEIATISSIFNRPLIVLGRDQQSGIEVIKDYGLVCSGDPIVLLHNKLNDSFILLSIPNIKSTRESLFSFIREYHSVRAHIEELIQFVAVRNEQLTKDRSTPPPAPSISPASIQTISRTGSQNKEKDKNTAILRINSQLTRRPRDIISLKDGQRITFNPDGSRTVSQASGQQIPSHGITSTNNPKLDDYLARQDLTIQIVLHFLHQMSMPNLDSIEELRRKYKHNTNIQMIVVAALMYVSQHGDATMLLKLLDISNNSNTNILLAFDHVMNWGHIDVVVKLLEKYGSTINPYGEKYSAYLLKAVARRGCSTSLARIFALDQSDASDYIMTIVSVIENEHYLLANDLIERLVVGLGPNSNEMGMLLSALAKNGFGSYILKILNTGEVQDRDAMIALIQAAQNNHQEAVTVILEYYSTSVDEQGEKSLTDVFKTSAEMGYTFLVAQMLQHCTLETLDLYEALAKAAEKGRSEVVLVLIDDTRIDINKTSPDEEQTLLHTAAVSGNVPFVNALLYGHADPNLTDKNGHTPLMLAVFNRHIDVVKRLLQEESTVITILCPDGKTLIEKAAELNNWVIHDLLSAALDELVNDIPRGDLDYSGDEVASDCDNLSNSSVTLKARLR